MGKSLTVKFLLQWANKLICPQQVFDYFLLNVE
jgi:hypothetical protein